MAKNNPKWFHSLLTVENTFDEEGNRVISEEAVQDERDAGMSEQMIQQEFYCSFDTGLVGAYYTDQLNRAEKEERIGDFPWIENQLVYTYWDLGYGDDCSVGFFQYDGQYIRMIDHMSSPGRDTAQWVKILRDLPYVYGDHTGPHDLEQHHQNTGKSILEVAQGLGFNFDFTPKMSQQQGINAVRGIMGKVRFNKPAVGDCLDSLFNYRREFDDKNKTFKERPLHDWSSHDADMFRYFAISWNDSPSLFLRDEFGSTKMPKVKKAIGKR